MMEADSQLRAYAGFVENIYAERITGWVWKPSSPELNVVVELYNGGVFVAATTADLHREDLLLAGIGDGNHAFEFALAEMFLPSDVLLVRVADTEWEVPELDGSRSGYEEPPLVIEAITSVADTTTTETDLEVEVLVGGADQESVQYPGHFEVSSTSTVIGWAAPQENGDPQIVEVLQDSTAVWSGPAQRINDGVANGFLVDLPPVIDWSRSSEISVRVAHSHAYIGQSIIIDPKRRFRGYVDLAVIEGSRICLSGWVQNQARPLNEMEITVFGDDVLIGKTCAEMMRQDLFDLGVGSGKHGFSLAIECDTSVLPKKIDIYEPYSGVLLFEGIAPEMRQLPGQVERSEGSARESRREFDQVEGSLDIVALKMVSGWARYLDEAGTPVLMDLYINNTYFSSTLANSFRSDLADHFGDDGRHAFTFEIPPHLTQDCDYILKVSARYGAGEIRSSTQSVRGLSNAKTLAGLNRAIPSSYSQTELKNEIRSSVCYIVLNLNASTLLQNLFETFRSKNRYNNYEIIVVDHGSTDGSLEICGSWKDKLNVRVLERGRNYSFSASNNFAAQYSNADIVIFLNNDIEFLQDVATEIVEILGDPEVGIVGIKLLDQKARDSYSANAEQHLGVHFDWTARDVAIKPFESRFAPHLTEVAEDLFDVPAVTGALMACRTADFKSVGGFDEAYFYGYEDVDLCIKFTTELRKRIVCANQIKAYHVRGFSRSQGGEQLNQRLAENRQLIQKKFGSVLRRLQAKDRFSKPGYWSSVVPRIAIAVTEVSDQAVAGDYFTALELAREIQKIQRCQILFIDISNWYNLSLVDVLITMRDDYDLSQIRGETPHLLKIGWARNWIDRWGSQPWQKIMT